MVITRVILRLCRDFDSHYDKVGRWNKGTKVVVDFLLTVDAAAGQSSQFLDRTEARCVELNYNYYSKSLKTWFSKLAGLWSYGAPNVESRDDQVVSNFEVNADHGAMQDRTLDDCVRDSALRLAPVVRPATW